MFVALLKALVSPAKAQADRGRTASRVSYGMLLEEFAATRWCRSCIVAGTLWLVWWYVVIHQQAAAEVVVTGVQQLGTPG